MADELVIAGIVDASISLGQLPNRPLHALLGRCEDTVDGAVLISIRVRQTQLDDKWLQSAIILEQQQGPTGVDLVGTRVDAPQVRHQGIMVIQNEELVLLQCLSLRQQQSMSESSIQSHRQPSSERTDSTNLLHGKAFKILLDVRCFDRAGMIAIYFRIKLASRRKLLQI